MVGGGFYPSIDDADRFRGSIPRLPLTKPDRVKRKLRPGKPTRSGGINRKGNAMLNDRDSEVARLAIGNAAEMCRQHFQELCGEWTLPSILYRPSLSLDGDKWIALYGENIQEGVVGIGDSPIAAMHAFDLAWCEKVKATGSN